MDCHAAVEAFLLAGSQWRWILAGDKLVRLGMDYAGVRALLAMARIRTSAELVRDLRLMEQAAMAAER